MENQDTFTEVTNEGWGLRILGSIRSVMFGIVLFLGAFVILWLNEGRSIKTAKGLTEGASHVISIDAQKIDKNNSGKLIHLTDKVNTKEKLKDDDFNINVNALKLSREVLMYQWVEKTEKKKEKKIGGNQKTTTTYNYEKKWKSFIVESSGFKIKKGHSNPIKLPYSSYTDEVSKATIGKFNLSSSLISMLSDFSPYSLKSIDTLKHKGAKIINDTSASNEKKIVSKVLIGKGTLSSPQIGDVKISFKIIKPNEEYSIVAKQVKNTFEAYKTKTDTNIEMISKGVLSAESMFSDAQSKNTILTWILRLVGFLIMFWGLSMVFKPLVILADVLPFLGGILNFGLSLFSGLISFGLSFITIAIAWVVYRPFLGITLLIIGVAIIIFILTRKGKNK